MDWAEWMRGHKAFTMLIVGSVFLMTGLALVLYYAVRNLMKPAEDPMHGVRWTSLDIDLKATDSDPSNSFETWKSKISALPHKIDFYPLHSLMPLQGLPSQFLYKACQLVSIQNQGPCNTCTIFAAYAMLANRLALITGGTPEMLSVQQFLDCTGHPCAETQPITKPFEFAANNGVVLAKTYPYATRTGDKCLIAERPEFRTRVFASALKSVSPHSSFSIGGSTHRATIERAKSEIYAFGPIVTVIEIFSDLMRAYKATAYDKVKKRYTSAIYLPTSGATSLGYHAIMLVGWNQPHANSYKDAYWCAVSSWGSAWPPSPQPGWPGLFFIQMGENTCGVEERMVTAQPVEVKL